MSPARPTLSRFVRAAAPSPMLRASARHRRRARDGASAAGLANTSQAWRDRARTTRHARTRPPCPCPAQRGTPAPATVRPWGRWSGSRLSEYAALLAHAGGALYGTELGSVTLKRIGFFCFPIKHSTHTQVQELLNLPLRFENRARASCYSPRAVFFARATCGRRGEWSKRGWGPQGCSNFLKTRLTTPSGTRGVTRTLRTVP